jgi:uncharacterized protein YbjT (DUF2867 family)
MNFLITGATGAIGRLVAGRLAAQGHRVHTLSRKPAPPAPNVKTFTGDLTGTSFDPAMWRGVEALFLFPAWGGPVDGFLAQAKAAGVEHAVVLSSLAAAQEFPRDLNSNTALHHLGIEAAVRRSGLQSTILRPGSFANNLRQWAPTIRSQGAVFGPYPDSAQAVIHEADIADCAAALLMEPRSRGRTHALTGPEALTQRDQLKHIGAVLGRDLTYHKIPPEQFRASLAAFVPDATITMLLDYWSDTESVPDAVTGTVAELTGRPARTLAEWARDHVSDFVG